MEEIWKDVGIIKGVDYTGLYQVSNYGQVRSLDRTDIYLMKGKEVKRSRKSIIMTPVEDKYGYVKIQLCKNGKHKWFQVHRLVAQAFIPNPNNYPCVNHKNEIKDDNRVDNLEWCTVKYNNIYNGRQKRITAKRKKITLQIDQNTNEIIKEWSSIKEAEKELGLPGGHISMCCNGKRKICGGYKWAFKKGDC